MLPYDSLPESWCDENFNLLLNNLSTAYTFEKGKENRYSLEYWVVMKIKLVSTNSIHYRPRI